MNTGAPTLGDSYRYIELEQWLLQGIHERRWSYGERLPSIRELCREQGLSRATVQHALQRLEAQGVVESRPRSGYFVALVEHEDDAAPGHARVRAPHPATVSDLLHDIMRRRGAFDIAPDSGPAELPPTIVALNRAIGRAMRRQGSAAHHYYDEPAGAPALRGEISRLYQRRGCTLPAEQLCITSGCQHALYLALQACCQPGDVVAVESPGFYGSLQLLEQLGLQVLEIPASPTQGLDTDALARALRRWRIAACLVSPSFATPTGALMPEAGKHALLELAQAHDFALIEDDIYADTALGPRPDPLKALDAQERVILCSSLSKSLSRDLRLGWISGGRWHDKIEKLKLVNLLASNQSLQLGTAAFMADGGYLTHLRRQQGVLREQRDTLVKALNSWPGEHRFSEPQGGLALWLELHEGIDVAAVYPAALEAGLVITPGTLFSVSRQFKHCLRLSFEQPWTGHRLAALDTLPALLGLA